MEKLEFINLVKDFRYKIEREHNWNKYPFIFGGCCGFISIDFIEQHSLENECSVISGCVQHVGQHFWKMRKER